MNKLHIVPITAALTLLLAGTAHAGSATKGLLPPAQSDLVPQTLRTVPPASPTPKSSSIMTATAVMPTVDHRPAHVSWQLDRSRSLETAPQPYDQRSREYWQNVSADQLKRGLKLPISSAGALIRLSPTGGTFGQINPQRMQVTQGKQTLTGSAAMSHMAGATQLQQAGLMVAGGSIMVKLRPSIGTGQIMLKADDAKGRYVMHVYEPKSTMVLHAKTDRDTIVSGQSIRLNVRLDDAGRNHAMDAVGGFLVAADGHIRNLRYHRNANGSYHVKVTPDAGHADRRGLWELHTFTSATDANGNTVLRDVTTAFAVSVTDARLNGSARVRRRHHRGINIIIGVDTVQASRYAVSGVLYGHASNGRLKPMAYAQSANWLQPGKGSINLRFNAGSMAGSTLRPPYELRDLKLVDQAHMGILERRAVALRFSP